MQSNRLELIHFPKTHFQFVLPEEGASELLWARFGCVVLFIFLEERQEVATIPPGVCVLVSLNFARVVKVFLLASPRIFGWKGVGL